MKKLVTVNIKINIPYYAYLDDVLDSKIARKSNKEEKTIGLSCEYSQWIAVHA